MHELKVAVWCCRRRASRLTSKREARDCRPRSRHWPSSAVNQSSVTGCFQLRLPSRVVATGCGIDLGRPGGTSTNTCSRDRPLFRRGQSSGPHTTDCRAVSRSSRQRLSTITPAHAAWRHAGGQAELAAEGGAVAVAQPTGHFRHRQTGKQLGRTFDATAHMPTSWRQTHFTGEAFAEYLFGEAQRPCRRIDGEARLGMSGQQSAGPLAEGIICAWSRDQAHALGKHHQAAYETGFCHDRITQGAIQVPSCREHCHVR